MIQYDRDEHRYDDIINLPHHQSPDRPHMSFHDRAAQFAPFAALSGHEEAIEETARLTDERIILDESAMERINGVLSEAILQTSDKPTVSITYFRPDALKSGGAYLTDVGTIKKIDEIEKRIIMDSGMKIPLEQVVKVEKQPF